MASPLNRLKHIHFIGVGGVGMSALALILADRGYSISGSDQKINQSVRKLISKGIQFFNVQTEENIVELCNKHPKPFLVVTSTAIETKNAELRAARANDLEICHRSDVLATLVSEHASIAVAGSHGKTTTSTFITTLLAIAGKDPTAAIGGLVPYYGSNSYSGQGRLLVAEADESDGSLVKLKAELGLITNLELDHTDYYQNIDQLIKTMKAFGAGCKKLLANYDCKILQEHLDASAWWSVKTFEGIDFAAIPISLESNQSTADFYEKGKHVGSFVLPVPGMHNLSNGIAAIAACRLSGLSFEEIKQNLSALEPPKRRFEFRGTWKGRHIIDDYAHHPSEVSATLAMARLMVNSTNVRFESPPKRLGVVFQPHRYSRTKEFLNDFASALVKADYLLLAPIYGAGESQINEVNSQTLANSLKQLNPNLTVLVSENLEHLTKLVKENSAKDDLIIAMGAGNVNSLWERLSNLEDTNQWLSTLAA